jgi:hypothetical protein
VPAFADLHKHGKVPAVGLWDVTKAQLDAARSTTTIASVHDQNDVTDRRSDGVLEPGGEAGTVFIQWVCRSVAGDLVAPG